MNTEKPKSRKPKSNGIIGRSSNKDCRKRKELCKKLINENHSMTKEFFLKEYTHLLETNNLAVPSNQTMIADAKKCNISFSKGIAADSTYTLFNYLGHLLSPEIRQIRLTCKKCDKKLLDINTYSYKISSFKSKAKKINSTLENSLSRTEIIYLSFILNENGLEEYIKHIFDTELSDPKEFLYIEICYYCVKIYFEYKDYNVIMGKTLEIVETLQPYE